MANKNGEQKPQTLFLPLLQIIIESIQLAPLLEQHVLVLLARPRLHLLQLHQRLEVHLRHILLRILAPPAGTLLIGRLGGRRRRESGAKQRLGLVAQRAEAAAEAGGWRLLRQVGERGHVRALGAEYRGRLGFAEEASEPWRGCCWRTENTAIACGVVDNNC